MLYYICKKIIKRSLQSLFGLPIPRLLISRKSNIVLAMTGQDFKALPVFSFIKQGIKIESILALDGEAICIASKMKIPFVTYEDILSETELAALANEAAFYSWNWANNISQVNIGEVNWAHFDHEALFYVIHELFFARGIAQKLKKNGRKLLVVQRDPFTAPEYYYGVDNFAYGAASVADAVFSRIIIRSRKESSLNRMVCKWPEPGDIKKISNKIVCVLNVVEIDRCREILNSLCKAFPERICIFALGQYSGDFSRAPIFSTPLPHVTDDLSFMSIVDHFDAQFGFEQELAPHIKKILQSYCKCRWPSLKQVICRFKEFFSLYRPACVVGTTLVDAESQSAIAAARQLGIPTLAWGHALFQGELPQLTAENVVVLCRYAMRSHCLQNNANAYRLIACYDSGLDILYPVVEEKWVEDKFKVLVLPSPHFVEGTSYHMCSFHALANFFKILCSYPCDMTSNVSVRFKCHPLHTIDHIFDFIGLDCAQWCFPKDKDLLTLLDQADCCILLGEVGCAVAHSCSRVPTVFCSIPRYTNFAYENLILREFPHRCERAEDIWGMIRHIMADKNYAQQMLDAQKEWVKYDSTYPTIVQVLQNLLDGKGVKHEKKRKAPFE